MGYESAIPLNKLCIIVAFRLRLIHIRMHVFQSQAIANRRSIKTVGTILNFHVPDNGQPLPYAAIHKIVQIVAADYDIIHFHYHIIAER